ERNALGLVGVLVRPPFVATRLDRLLAGRSRRRRCRGRRHRRSLSLRRTSAALSDEGLERDALGLVCILVCLPFFRAGRDRLLLRKSRHGQKHCADDGATDDDGTHPQLLWLKSLGFLLALGHETLLRGAGERLAVAAHGLAFAGVVFALLDETGFRG